MPSDSTLLFSPYLYTNYIFILFCSFFSFPHLRALKRVWPSSLTLLFLPGHSYQSHDFTYGQCAVASQTNSDP